MKYEVVWIHGEGEGDDDMMTVLVVCQDYDLKLLRVSKHQYSILVASEWFLFNGSTFLWV